MKNLKKQVISVFVSGCLFLTTSCATVLRGTTHEFPIQSDIPTNVKVTGANDGVVIDVKTPTTLRLKRNQGYRVEVTAQGYAPQTFQVTSTLDMGWLLIGDILVAGGIIGVIVDIADGAAYTLNPKELNIAFQQGSSLGHSENSIRLTQTGRYLIPLEKIN